MLKALRAILRTLGRIMRFVWDPIKKVGSWVGETSLQVIEAGGEIGGRVSAAVGKIPAGLLSSFAQKVAPAPASDKPVEKAKAANAKATDEQRAVEATRAALNASVDAATLVRRLIASVLVV